MPAHPAAAAIRAQVLAGIAGNRTPGLHFPGYFLGFARPRFDGAAVELAVPYTPCTGGSGSTLDPTVLCFLADTALATATRGEIAPGARLATLHLQMQFTGVAAAGEVCARAQPLGQHAGTAVPQLLAAATLATAAGVVARASGEFGALAPPPGVALAPLPWQLPPPPAARLVPADLTPAERPLLRACNQALAKAVRSGTFIEHFWGGQPIGRADGARLRCPIGPHLANRVGHVQGGISLGIAARCAGAAAPAHMQLSALAAWYIGPGRGRALTVRSRTLHTGRTVAVVRTEVRTDAGARVLEVVTHHVARGAPDRRSTA